MSWSDTLTWTDAALRDHDAETSRDDAWALHVERCEEEGICPYCTEGLRLDDRFGCIRPCPECHGTGRPLVCDGSGVALPN